jgi:RNA polymerase sigma-70 factor (ECF subfamily)
MRGSALTTALISASPDLLAYLARRVGPDDAPDLLGDTMMVAWRRAEDLPEDSERARMWLFGIARGTLLNHARGERRRSALADRVRAEFRETAPAADTASEVRDAIDRLAPELAEIVRLRHWDGFTLAEVGRLLDMPASTVRSRYQQAREQLRATL